MIKSHRIFSSLVTFLFIFYQHLAIAAIPDNIDYQGYLSDSGGSPISTTVSVTFSLYNVDAGGVALWTDTQPVTPNNGLFTVKLGSAGNPFPAGLFDAPIYIGINVAGDGEMSPRAALSSAGFAHKANDADSVGGVAASSLATSSDLTAHSSNASAHHTKTSNFTELSGQVSNAQIPATITRDSELSNHAGNAGAHHSRYTNAEAVGAMGAQSDANPLNHSKRSNAQVMAAVTSLDGPGSTLDADLVDGMQASEIIDAASDEVRIPISSLPLTINQPGSYYLTGNLNGSGGGIDIPAENVTIDLMGFTMDGGGVNDYAFNLSSGNNITIKNGTIRNFGYAGIISGVNVSVIDMNILDNGSLGTGSSFSAINVGGYARIERCRIGGNGGSGISTLRGSEIINNIVFNNTGQYGISAWGGSLIKDNTVYNQNAAGGRGISGLTGSRIIGNTLENSGGEFGIYGASMSIIRENTVTSGSYTNAIKGEAGVIVSKNTVKTNTGSGINVSLGSTVINNIVTHCASWGIYVYSSIVKDNILRLNNSSLDIVRGGLYVAGASRVVDNLFEYNNMNSIQVNFNGSVIENNLLKSSGTGLRFYANGNYYANNKSTGNTINYNLGGTVQTNGGGNISF